MKAPTTEMTVNELYDLVLAASAAHHSFNQQGALYSNLDNGWERIQEWCDRHCDAFEQEIRSAVAELKARDLSSPNHIELRTIAIGIAAPFVLATEGDQE